MSILGNVVKELDKATQFLVKIFTKADQIDKDFAALGPETKAAILSTFYDVSKTVASGIAVAGDVASGNLAGAVTLSATTFTLVTKVVQDAKADIGVAKADLTALGIAA